jgi:hypothetical protein
MSLPDVLSGVRHRLLAGDNRIGSLDQAVTADQACLPPPELSRPAPFGHWQSVGTAADTRS